MITPHTHTHTHTLSYIEGGEKEGRRGEENDYSIEIQD